MLIEKCQEISAAQCIRISFLSGDVHVCAAGRLYSDPKVKNVFFMPRYCYRRSCTATYFFSRLKISTFLNGVLEFSCAQKYSRQEGMRPVLGVAVHQDMQQQCFQSACCIECAL